jgi:LysR family transcriptional activator of nhaA
VVPPIVVKDELESGVLVEIATLPGLMGTLYALTMPRQFPHPLLQEVLRSSMLS